jgi:hypothetical protein
VGTKSSVRQEKGTGYRIQNGAKKQVPSCEQVIDRRSQVLRRGKITPQAEKSSGSGGKMVGWRDLHWGELWLSGMTIN